MLFYNVCLTCGSLYYLRSIAVDSPGAIGFMRKVKLHVNNPVLNILKHVMCVQTLL